MDKENFILAFEIKNEELLDGLIDYHKNNSEYKYKSEQTTHDIQTKTSTDVNVQFVSNNKHIKDYTGYLVSGLKEYHKKYEHFNPELCIQEGFNIQHYGPGQGYKSWHNERPEYQINQRALVFMTYLNDVPDGGGTEFAYYPDLKIKARKGLTLLWPTDFTHTHRGIISQHEKYIITGWFHHLGVAETKATILDKMKRSKQ